MLVGERKALLRRAERNRWPEGTPSPELARRGLAIQERFLAVFPPAAGRMIALYEAVRGEVSTGTIRAACLAAGAFLFYPRIMDDGDLSFFRHRENDGWITGMFGLPEPLARPGDRGIREGFDLVIVPGLAFDRRGRRLGQGHGYYDRFLKGLAGSAVTAGLAFSWQVVPEVPVEAWDVPVDVLVTEEDVLRISGDPLHGMT